MQSPAGLLCPYYVHGDSAHGSRHALLQLAAQARRVHSMDTVFGSVARRIQCGIPASHWAAGTTCPLQLQIAAPDNACTKCGLAASIRPEELLESRVHSMYTGGIAVSDKSVAGAPRDDSHANSAAAP